jgi:putative two-component system response regulator
LWRKNGRPGATGPDFRRDEYSSPSVPFGLADSWDNETGNHIRRTQLYLERLARALRARPELNRHLYDEDVELATSAAPLHDIGKIGVPDRILLKPGKLTPAEFEIMKTHTSIGNEALVRAESHITSGQAKFLLIAREIAHAHHERWDGTGYPRNLKGEQIPLVARVMAVADVYDAIISKRVYKDSKSHEEACEYIASASGTHFDPAVVEAFIEVAEDFRAISRRFEDV